MFKEFKKCASRLCKRAALVGVGVLFALNAAATTAHAISAKDIIGTLPTATPQKIVLLDSAIKQAAGDTKAVIVDVGKIQDESARLETSVIAEREAQINAVIKKNILQDKGSDYQTKQEVAGSIEKMGVAKRFYSVSNGQAFAYRGAGPFAQHTQIENANKEGYGLIHTLAGSSDLDKALLGYSTMQHLGPEASILLRTFIVVHEAKHLSQRVQFRELGRLNGYIEELEKEPETNKTEIETYKKQYAFAISKTEMEADIAGARAVMKIASSEEAGLAFLTAWAGFRASEILFGNTSTHNSLAGLTKFINTYDPSIPVMDDVPFGEIKHIRNDAVAAFETKSRDPSTNAVPFSKSGKDLLAIYEHAIQKAIERGTGNKRPATTAGVQARYDKKLQS